MKALVWPGLQSGDYLLTCPVGLISGQPYKIQPRAQVGCREEIPLFDGRGKQVRDASRYFEDLTKIQERAEHESLRNRQLPGNPGTLVTQNLRRTFTEFSRTFPMSYQVCADAPGPDCQGNRVRVSNLLGQGLRLFGNLHRSFPAAHSPGSSLRCFESQSPRHAIRLARPQRQQQVPALKIGAADKIGHSQTRGDAPAEVNPKQA